MRVMRNKELDSFAQSLYEAYGSFRVAGFEERKAFALTTTFMVTLLNKQGQQAEKQEAGKDDNPAAQA
jgi:hypothetical protein